MKFPFTDYKEITFCGRFEIFNFIGSINYIFVMDSMVKKVLSMHSTGLRVFEELLLSGVSCFCQTPKIRIQLVKKLGK